MNITLDHCMVAACVPRSFFLYLFIIQRNSYQDLKSKEGKEVLTFMALQIKPYVKMLLYLCRRWWNNINMKLILTFLHFEK